MWWIFAGPIGYILGKGSKPIEVPKGYKVVDNFDTCTYMDTGFCNTSGYTLEKIEEPIVHGDTSGVK
jgi:hypothetical protein